MCQQKEYGIFMHQRGFQVWGSSSGWLLFYAAFACKVAGVGYELLGCHVDFANELLYSMLNKLEQTPGVHQRGRTGDWGRGVYAGTARGVAHVAVLGPVAAKRGE